jgi:L-seryl-tRNA(Ser) seleniumtransferase
MADDTKRPAELRPPSIDCIVRSSAAAPLVAAHGRSEVTRAAREVVEALRRALQAGQVPALSEEAVIEAVSAALAHSNDLPLRRVLNLTGTVLHTNLGRAALPEEAIAAVAEVARGASNLEYDIAAGRRGDRDQHLEAALQRIVGCEAATVVNNNAAAVMLVLNTLALGKEVPVSRGELVEIGGSFRIPEIMSRSGCTLVEVGTTNRTHARDFERALGPMTAMIMKVHTSNYVIDGFTASVPESDLAALCHARGLPFVVDLGAGSLVDLRRYGLPHEPTPMEALRAGADLVTFSGDKLLGGPQAGIIAGRRALIERLKANPMKRALRCDKMTIAALAAVLRLYADPDRLAQRLPTLAALTRPVPELHALAQQLLDPFSRALADVATVTVTCCDSVIGSGALPRRTIPSVALAVRPTTERGSGTMLGLIARAFSALPTPVIGRIHDGAFLLDLRCLERAEELGALVAHLRVEP